VQVQEAEASEREKGGGRWLGGGASGTGRMTRKRRRPGWLSGWILGCQESQTWILTSVGFFFKTNNIHLDRFYRLTENWWL
jgi:hypothetical protein